MSGSIKRTAFLIFLVCLFLPTFPSRVESEPDQAIPLASVAGEPITQHALKKEGSRRPARYALPEQRKALLQEMVRFRLLHAAAKKAGYEQDPEIVARLKRLMVKKFLRDRLEPRLAKLTVTEAEAKDFYRKHNTEYMRPPMVRAAVVQITLHARASQQKKEELAQRAETARAEALNLNQATLSFGSVAVKYSDHQPTRYRGGDTGWIDPSGNDPRWPKKVVEAIFSLTEPGKVSPVIETPSGFYIVKLMETRESEARPFETVRDRIRHRLIEQKKADVERAFYAALKAEIPVQVFDARLESVDWPEDEAEVKHRSPPALPGR